MNNIYLPLAQGLSYIVSPVYAQKRSLGWQVLAVIVGSLFLTLASYIQVPMVPVPVTMQTYAICLVGALYGWRLGALTVIFWLLEAVAGLPVLAGGAGGYLDFVGPTAGYLFAFPLVAAIVGYFAERGYNGERAFIAFLVMLGAGAFCLLLGAIWLAFGIGIGVEKAIAYGVLPFIAGDFLKSALGGLTLKWFVFIKKRLPRH